MFEQTTYVPIRVMITDDHDLYRDGLRGLLQKSTHLQVVGEASNGRELLTVCETDPPDVVLMDIMMPIMDGIETTQYLSSHYPAVRVIALSMFNQDNLILDMINAGAVGYLIKNANKAEILEAISSAYRNIPFYCSTTSLRLAKLIAMSQKGPRSQVYFTSKELIIIRMICEERTSKEIGDALYLSGRTVEEYRVRIREKMEAKNTAGMVIYAIRNELFKLE